MSAIGVKSQGILRFAQDDRVAADFLLCPPPVDERRRSYRALVVEDDMGVLTLVKKVLERESFIVEGVGNGAAAIALLETVAYDLLIIDLILPVVSGAQVLDFLERTKPETLRRVIVTTASPQLSYAFLQKICRILAKPFDIKKLILFARECVEVPAA